jgi:hypothetical protein
MTAAQDGRIPETVNMIAITGVAEVPLYQEDNEYEKLQGNEWHYEAWVEIPI